MSLNFIKDGANVRYVYRIYFSGDEALDGVEHLSQFSLPRTDKWVFEYGAINFSTVPLAPILTPIYMHTGYGLQHTFGNLAGAGTAKSNFYQPDQSIYLLPGDMVFVKIATTLDPIAYTDPASFDGFLSFRRDI